MESFVKKRECNAKRNHLELKRRRIANSKPIDYAEESSSSDEQPCSPSSRMPLTIVHCTSISKEVVLTETSDDDENKENNRSENRISTVDSNCELPSRVELQPRKNEASTTDSVVKETKISSNSFTSSAGDNASSAVAEIPAVHKASFSHSLSYSSPSSLSPSKVTRENLEKITTPSGSGLDDTTTIQTILLNQTKIITMLKDIETRLLNMERKSEEDPKDVIKSILPQKLDTSEQLNQFCDKLNDKNVKTQLVKGLVDLNKSPNIGQTIRKSLDTLMTRRLMEQYSVNGQRGKLPLANTHICHILFSAARQCHHEMATFDLVKEYISRYMKGIPHQKGGTKHKVKQESSN